MQEYSAREERSGGVVGAAAIVALLLLWLAIDWLIELATNCRRRLAEGISKLMRMARPGQTRRRNSATWSS